MKAPPTCRILTVYFCVANFHIEARSCLSWKFAMQVPYQTMPHVSYETWLPSLYFANLRLSQPNKCFLVVIVASKNIQSYKRRYLPPNEHLWHTQQLSECWLLQLLQRNSSYIFHSTSNNFHHPFIAVLSECPNLHYQVIVFWISLPIFANPRRL